METNGAIMHQCNYCDRLFKTKTKLKTHKSRKTPCKHPTHFCSMCKRGMSSYRTLWAHKRVCKKRPGVSIETEEKIQRLRTKINIFLNQLTDNFTDKLDELDKLFIDTNEFGMKVEIEKKDNCVENDLL